MQPASQSPVNSPASIDATLDQPDITFYCSEPASAGNATPAARQKGRCGSQSSGLASRRREERWGDRAYVIGDKGATVQQLADDIHLTASEFKAWLKTTKKGDTLPSSPTTPLTSQQTFSIPNTVVTFVPALRFSFQSEFENFIMPNSTTAVQQCEDDAPYSGKACTLQGWHNELVIGWGGTTEAFEDSFSSNDVAAVFYGGHGVEDVNEAASPVITTYGLSCPDGEVSAASMGLGRNFKLHANLSLCLLFREQEHRRKSRRSVDRFSSRARHLCRFRRIPLSLEQLDVVGEIQKGHSLRLRIHTRASRFRPR